MALRSLFCAVMASAMMLAASPAWGIVFNEVARFNASFAFASDLDPMDEILDDNPKYIGTNPLAIAWNGSKLYMAGFDNSGSSLLPIGLIEVLDATRTGLVTVADADLSAKFGPIFQPPGRGYTGLALSGNKLAAAYDAGSPPDGPTQNAIQVFDTSTNTLLWDLSASGLSTRGYSGVAFDPGFPGGVPANGVGVAWTTIASGRRALLDPDTGGIIHDLTGQNSLGMQWSSDTATSFVPGDLAFDPVTGDIFARRSNNVDAADRTGDNATANRRSIVDNGENGPFILGQKIGFLSNTSEGDLLIYNDRSNTLLGKAFLDVVKVVNTDGVAQTATYNLLGGLTGADMPTTAGIYDFDYDPGTNTLALLDFTNRNVHIFAVGDQTGLEGNFNGDSVVDAADYTVWRDGLGTTYGAADYDVWKGNYGAVAGSALASSSAVPEPGTLALLAFCFGAMSLPRRR